MGIWKHSICTAGWPLPLGGELGLSLSQYLYIIFPPCAIVILWHKLLPTTEACWLSRLTWRLNTKKIQQLAQRTSVLIITSEHRPKEPRHQTDKIRQAHTALTTTPVNRSSLTYSTDWGSQCAHARWRMCPCGSCRVSACWHISLSNASERASVLTEPLCPHGTQTTAVLCVCVCVCVVVHFMNWAEIQPLLSFSLSLSKMHLEALYESSTIHCH